MQLNPHIKKRVVAIVGMAGSGKSDTAEFFKKHEYPVIRFGDITDKELAARGLELNEDNEKMISKHLRDQHGMDVYAKKSLPQVEEALKGSDIVFIDGLYSWHEYVFLKNRLNASLVVLLVYSPPRIRYKRLSQREHRPLTKKEAIGRDEREIEDQRKAGPIAMADYVINNFGTKESLKKNLVKFLKVIKHEK